MEKTLLKKGPLVTNDFEKDILNKKDDLQNQLKDEAEIEGLLKRKEIRKKEEQAEEEFAKRKMKLKIK